MSNDTKKTRGYGEQNPHQVRRNIRHRFGCIEMLRENLALNNTPQYCVSLHCRFLVKRLFFYPRRQTFYRHFQKCRKRQILVHKTIKPVILCFLHNKKRGKWPFSNMVMRGLFLRKKKFLKKAGFLARFHGDSEGTFSMERF